MWGPGGGGGSDANEAKVDQTTEEMYFFYCLIRLFRKVYTWEIVTAKYMVQGHPTTVFWEISVRSPLEWLKFSGAQEQLKISKMFCGDCSLGSEFRDLCGLFT